MKYDKQKYKQSEAAYKRANKLSYWKDSAKEYVGAAESLLWLGCGMFAIPGVYFAGDPALNFIEFLFVLLVCLSPAIAFDVIRRIIRGIMNIIISGNYKTGQYYVKYENEILSCGNRYAKAIDKIVALAKSNDKNVKREIELLAQDMDKESGKLSLDQEAKIEKSVCYQLEHDTKDFTVAEKKKLMQLFEEVSKSR